MMGEAEIKVTFEKNISYDIYYAAPLHNDTDQLRNITYTNKLRALGHRVYLPQECGVWETMVARLTQEGVDPDEAKKIIRHKLFLADRNAVGRCDCVVVNFGDRAPSEGGLWEMGYAYGLGKPVYLLNMWNWAFNIMPEYGSIVFDRWDDLTNYLAQESFV